VEKYHAKRVDLDTLCREADAIALNCPLTDTTRGMINMENRDKKWGDIFSASMFIGMISAFLGYVFCDFATVFSGNLSGLIPPLVMLVSALVMCLAGLIVKKYKWRWVGDYALPISLIAGMASAIPITAWLS